MWQSLKVFLFLERTDKFFIRFTNVRLKPVFSLQGCSCAASTVCLWSCREVRAAMARVGPVGARGCGRRGGGRRSWRVGQLAMSRNMSEPGRLYAWEDICLYLALRNRKPKDWFSSRLLLCSEFFPCLWGIEDQPHPETVFIRLLPLPSF